MWAAAKGLEKQQEENCSFLAAMQHGRDHEHRVGSTTRQVKKYWGRQQELPVAGSKVLGL